MASPTISEGGPIVRLDLSSIATLLGVVRSVNTLQGNVILAAGANITLTPVGNTITISAAGGGAGVSSFNTLTGAVVLAAGTNITLTPIGNTITIDAAGGVSSLNTLTGAVVLAAGTNITLTPVGNTITIDAAGGGAGVSSLNTLTGAVVLAAGTNITLTPVGNTITIDAAGGGAGVSSLNTLTGAVVLAAGTNITLTPVGNTITVDAAGGVVSCDDTDGGTTALTGVVVFAAGASGSMQVIINSGQMEFDVIQNPITKAFRTSNQVIPDTVQTLITWQSTIYGGMGHALPTTTYDAPVTGNYLVTLHIQVSFTAAPTSILMQILQNGSRITEYSDTAPVAATGLYTFEISTPVTLTAGDTISANFQSVSSGAADATIFGGTSPGFTSYLGVCLLSREIPA
jgi:hypothetical protein